MKYKRILVGLMIASVLLLCISVVAQVNRPYRNGSVWSIGFIRMKPGMETAYLNYIATDWKREQEELKKDGLSLSYKVLRTEAQGLDVWKLIVNSMSIELALL